MMNKSQITVGIHQPNFMPWIGYFYKMLHSDIFILLDDVQYIRRGFTGRVKIKTPGDEKWLTIPVKKKGKYFQSINEVELENNHSWKKKTLCTLQSCYGKAPYFKTYSLALESIIQKEHRWLVELNGELLKWMAEVLEIKTKVVKSSEMEGVTGKSTDRLVSLCQSLSAARYLSGFGGQKYQEKEIFNKHNIELVIYDFKHPVYPQMFEAFIPGLSAIDLLFNCGPESSEILKKI